MSFADGVPTCDLKITENKSGIEHGTEVTFLPSAETFTGTEFSFDTMETWLREQSYLNANVKIILEDLRGSEKKEREFHSVDGLKGFATYLDKSKELLNKEPIQMIKQQEDTYIEIVLQWTTAYTETSLCFTNNIPNRDGGTHLAGFRAGLTRAINKYISEKGTKKDINLSGEDFREGLTSIVSVKIPDPKFGSQTKDKLVSSEVRPIVESTVSEMLYEFLDENPAISKTIIDKIIESGKINYGFDAYKEIYCDMLEAGIVDPTKVTRSALENAASVAAMVLTTESLIADKPEDIAAANAVAAQAGGMY
jgi:DNA gyrase subunit B